MQIGLVGLQYSGKTTLFNTLAGIIDDQTVQKEEASREVVKVPDYRLDKCTELFNPKKKVNAVIEVLDIPGLKTSEDGKVRIKDSDCRDKYCVKQGWLDAGSSRRLICMPNRLIIEFAQKENNAIDAVTE